MLMYITDSKCIVVLLQWISLSFSSRAAAGSSSGPSDLLQCLDVQSSSVSEARLMNMISETLVNVMKSESQPGEGTRDNLVSDSTKVISHANVHNISLRMWYTLIYECHFFVD